MERGIGGNGGLVNRAPTPALGKIYTGPNDHHVPYGVGVPFTNPPPNDHHIPYGVGVPFTNPLLKS